MREHIHMNINFKSVSILLLVILSTMTMVYCGTGKSIPTSSDVNLPPRYKQSGTAQEMDAKFITAVQEYVENSWTTWELGEAMGECLIEGKGELSKTAKEAIIELGVDEAFDELEGLVYRQQPAREHLESLTNVWNACEAELQPASSP